MECRASEPMYSWRMKPVDTLIHARWTVPIEPAGALLDHHTLVVNQGRIVALLPAETAKQLYSSEQSLERPTHVLLPGLVNANTRAAMSLLRGAPADATGERWQDPEFVRDATQLAIAAMLRAGITCFADTHLYPEVVAQTAAAQHIRACVGLLVTATPTNWAQSPEEYIDKGLGVRDNYRDDPLITTAFACHDTTRLDDAILARMGRAADEIELPLLMTLHQSAEEISSSITAHGLRPIARLQRLGLLTPLLAAVHMTHLSAEDMHLVAGAGISAVYCPQTDLQLHGGAGEIARLHPLGINIALGSGDAARVHAFDLITEMRTAALPANALKPDAALAPHDILAMATLNGARALGLAAETGSLVPDKWADVCCIDLAHLQTQPVYDPAAHIVYAASRDQVSDVWVAGRHLLNAGTLARMDLPALLRLAEHWRQRIARPPDHFGENV